MENNPSTKVYEHLRGGHDHGRARVFSISLLTHKHLADTVDAFYGIESLAALAIYRLKTVANACLYLRRHVDAKHVYEACIKLFGSESFPKVLTPINPYDAWLAVCSANRGPCAYVKKGGSVVFKDELLPSGIQYMDTYCKLVEAAHMHAQLFRRHDIKLPKFEDIYVPDESDDTGDEDLC